MLLAMSAAPSLWERDGVRPPVHDASPIEPAMAVNTAMRILRMETHPQDPLSPLDSSPSMGSAEFDAFLLVIDINVLGFKDKYFS